MSAYDVLLYVRTYHVRVSVCLSIHVSVVSLPLCMSARHAFRLPGVCFYVSCHSSNVSVHVSVVL